jgi:hypothetical protein
MDGIDEDIFLNEKRRVILDFLVETEQYVLSATDVAGGTLKHYDSQNVDKNGGISYAERYGVVYRPPKLGDGAKSDTAPPDAKAPERWIVPIKAMTGWLDQIHYSFPDPPTNEMASAIVSYIDARLDSDASVDPIGAIFAAYAVRFVSGEVDHVVIEHFGKPDVENAAETHAGFPFLEEIQADRGWEHKFDEYLIDITIEVDDLERLPTAEQLEVTFDGLLATLLTTAMYDRWRDNYEDDDDDADHRYAFSQQRAQVTESAEKEGSYMNSVEFDVDIDWDTTTVSISSYQRKWKS